MSDVNTKGAADFPPHRWEPILVASGPIARRLVILALGTVAFFGCLLGVGTWIGRSVGSTLPPKEGFAHFYYYYGDFAGWAAALLAIVMVAYPLLIASGALPLLWACRSDKGVRLASTLGRVGLRTRTLVLGPELEARLFNDGMTPEIRVLDLTSRGKLLRVRCFSPMGEETAAGFVAVLEEYGVEVTLANDLFDP